MQKTLLIGITTSPTVVTNSLEAVNISVTGNITGDGGVNVTGINDLTVGGDVSIGGTITYQDVTDVNAVGLVTAQLGMRIGAGQSIGVAGGGVENVEYYGKFVGVGSDLTSVPTAYKTDTVTGVGVTLLHFTGAGVQSMTAPDAGISTVTITGGGRTGTQWNQRDFKTYSSANYTSSSTYDFQMRVAGGIKGGNRFCSLRGEYP